MIPEGCPWTPATPWSVQQCQCPGHVEIRRVQSAKANAAYSEFRYHRDPSWSPRIEADEIAVERAVHGQLHGATLNLREREEAFTTLARVRPDLSARLVAERLGCAERTVFRYRARTKEST